MRYLRENKSKRVSWRRVVICLLGVLALSVLASGFQHLYSWRSFSEGYHYWQRQVNAWSEQGVYPTPEAVGLDVEDVAPENLEMWWYNFVQGAKARAEFEAMSAGVRLALVSLPVSIIGILIALSPTRGSQPERRGRKKLCTANESEETSSS